MGIRNPRASRSTPPTLSKPVNRTSARPLPRRAGASSHHPRGAAALELDREGKITDLTVVWDGSLLEDTAIMAAAAHAVDL